MPDSLPLNEYEMLKLAGPIGRFAAGTYACPCYDCGQTFTGAKDARQCLPCAIAELKAAAETKVEGDTEIKITPVSMEALARVLKIKDPKVFLEAINSLEKFK